MRSYTFKEAGEIRFGPRYYSLEIDSQPVPEFLYGSHHNVICNGRYLVTEEWLTIDYEQGPITRVAIFDLELGLVSKLRVVDQGFVSEFKLSDGVFSYTKAYLGKGKVIMAELDWSSITNWTPIHN